MHTHRHHAKKKTLITLAALGQRPALLAKMALKERDMGDSFRTIVDPLASLEFDPPWAFGNLGFKFWNWPPLEEPYRTDFRYSRPRSHHNRR
jgi:hypothetical protein